MRESCDVNPNKADKYGRTPLSFSARNGHGGVVRTLLEPSNVNPNTADMLFGQTPLSLAAQNGHEGVVRILLERNDVNLGTAGDGGQTPLLLAAYNGQENCKVAKGAGGSHSRICSMPTTNRAPLPRAVRSF